MMGEWRGTKCETMGVSRGQIHWIIPYLILWWYHEMFCQSLGVLFYWKSDSWESLHRAAVMSWDFTWLTQRGRWNCLLSSETVLHCPSIIHQGIWRYLVEHFTRLNYMRLHYFTNVWTNLKNSDYIFSLILAWPGLYTIFPRAKKTIHKKVPDSTLKGKKLTIFKIAVLSTIPAIYNSSEF